MKTRLFIVLLVIYQFFVVISMFVFCLWYVLAWVVFNFNIIDYMQGIGDKVDTLKQHQQ